MDDSILAKFSDDDSALGPFLGNLPSEILDVVVQKLGWFRTTFAMAGKTCRKAVKRVTSTRVLTEDDCMDLVPKVISLAGAVAEGDVEAMVWLMQLIDEKGLEWRNGYGLHLSLLAAERGKLESLKCLRANGCPWNEGTCSGAAQGGHLKVLQWLRQNGCPWDADTCFHAAYGGHLEVLPSGAGGRARRRAGLARERARGRPPMSASARDANCDVPRGRALSNLRET